MALPAEEDRRRPRPLEVAVALQDLDRVSVWGVARVGTRLFASDMLSGLFVIDLRRLVR